MFELRFKICLIDEALKKTKNNGISTNDYKRIILKLTSTTYNIHKYNWKYSDLDLI